MYSDIFYRRVVASVILASANSLVFAHPSAEEHHHAISVIDGWSEHVDITSSLVFVGGAVLLTLSAFFASKRKPR